MPRKEPNDAKFTDQMRQASRKAHSVSDAMVNARLVVLFTDRVLYARALACFYFVFRELERVLTPALAKDPRLQRFSELLPKMARTQAFAIDLQYYLGPDWVTGVELTPAITAYIKHLDALASSEPWLLVAHAYTQYLAVVAGGGIIRRMARKQMHLPVNHGTASFEFPEDAPATKLVAALKDSLNALAGELAEDERAKLIEEHVQAFRYNNNIIRTHRLGWGPFLRGLCILVISPITNAFRRKASS